MIIFFLASVILIILAIISFISSLIKKKSKKTALVFLLSSIVCFFISIMMSPSEPTTEKVGETESSDSESASSDLEEENNDSEIQATAAAEETYKVGDVIQISTYNGSYSFTITGISETSDRNEFSDIQADRVVVIDYEYENIDVPEELYISDMNFKAYDADNNALETYPADIKYADSISAGRKTTGQMAFALNNPTNRIELEYFDNMFSSTKDCLIVAEW